MSKKIGAIANGVNLDHIRQGNAWYIIKLLKLERNYPVGIGLNLPSQRLGYKDLVKIENFYCSEDQLERISLFAYGATYSEIKNFEIVRKIHLTLPKVTDLIICPNHRCISHQYSSKFHLHINGDIIIARCHYCEHNYDLDGLNQFNL
ncbi:MAG: hypothetical protein RLZZ293_1405 [Pseudomonadota bacterium]|jgi:aspartate carbamoyltransferase regulatory subunit